MITPEEDYCTWVLYLTELLEDNDLYIEMFNDFDRILTYFDKNDNLPDPIQQFSNLFSQESANLIIQNITSFQIPDMQQFQLILSTLSNVAVHVVSLFAKGYKQFELSISCIFNEASFIYASHPRYQASAYHNVLHNFHHKKGLISFVRAITIYKIPVTDQSPPDNSFTNITNIILKYIEIFFILFSTKIIDGGETITRFNFLYLHVSKILRSFDIPKLRNTDSNIFSLFLKTLVDKTYMIDINEFSDSDSDEMIPIPKEVERQLFDRIVGQNKTIIIHDILNFCIFCLKSGILEKQMMAVKILKKLTKYSTKNDIIKVWAIKNNSVYFPLILNQHFNENVLTGLQEAFKTFIIFSPPTDEQFFELWNLTAKLNTSLSYKKDKDQSQNSSILNSSYSSFMTDQIASEKDAYIYFLLASIQAVGNDRVNLLLDQILQLPAEPAPSVINQNTIDLLQIIASHSSSLIGERIAHFIIDLLKEPAYQEIAFNSIKEMAKDQGHFSTAIKRLFMGYCRSQLINASQNPTEDSGITVSLLEVIQCLVQNSTSAIDAVDEDLIDVILSYLENDYSESKTIDDSDNLRLSAIATGSQNLALNLQLPKIDSKLVFGFLKTCCSKAFYVITRSQFDRIWANITSYGFSCLSQIMLKRELSFLEGDDIIETIKMKLSQFDYSKSDVNFVNFVSLFILKSEKFQNHLTEGEQFEKTKFPTNFYFKATVTKIDGLEFLSNILNQCPNKTTAELVTSRIITFILRMTNKAESTRYLLNNFHPILLSEHNELSKTRICNLLYEYINSTEGNGLALEDYNLRSHKLPSVKNKVRILLNIRLQNDLYVDPSLPIKQICMKIAARLNLKTNNVVLWQQAKQLDRFATLKDYGISTAASLSVTQVPQQQLQQSHHSYYHNQHYAYQQQLIKSYLEPVPTVETLSSHVLYKCRLTSTLLDILRQYDVILTKSEHNEITELASSVYRLLNVLETDNRVLLSSNEPSAASFLLKSAKTPLELLYYIQSIAISIHDKTSTFPTVHRKHHNSFVEEEDEEEEEGIDEMDLQSNEVNLYVTDEIISLLLDNKICDKGLKDAYLIISMSLVPFLTRQTSNTSLKSEYLKQNEKAVCILNNIVTKLETIKSKSFIGTAVRLLKQFALLYPEETSQVLFSENTKLSSFLLKLDPATLSLLTHIFSALPDKPTIYKYLSAFVFQVNEVICETFCNIFSEIITSQCETGELTKEICKRLKVYDDSQQISHDGEQQETGSEPNPSVNDQNTEQHQDTHNEYLTIHKLNNPFLNGYCNILSKIFSLQKESDIIENLDVIDSLVYYFVADCDENTQQHIFKIFDSILTIYPNVETRLSKLLLPYFSIDSQQWNFDPKRYEKLTKFTGLKNLGATCYLNSTIQQLYMNDTFRNKIMNLEIPNEEIPSTINNSLTDLCEESKKSLEKNWKWISQLKELFARLENTKMPFISTREFCSNFIFNDNQPINTREQQDASEFYQALLDKLPKEVSQCYTGKFINIIQADPDSPTVILENGEKIQFRNETYESFSLIQVDVKGFKNLESSIRRYFEGCDLSYTVEEYKRKIDTKRFARIEEAPQFFVIQLKRFEYDVRTWNRYKVNDEFEFPFTLNISEIMHHADDDLSQYDYELTGIIIHDGHVEGGHYYSLIKSKESLTEWFAFNDTLVEEISLEELKLLSFGSNTTNSNYFGPSAYILLYSKTNSPPPNSTKYTVSPQFNKIINEENQLYLHNQCVFRNSVSNLVSIHINDWKVILSFFLNVTIHSKQFADLPSLQESFWTSLKALPDNHLAKDELDLYLRHKRHDALQMILKHKEIVKEALFQCSTEQILHALIKIVTKLIEMNPEETSKDFILYLLASLKYIMPVWKQIPFVTFIINQYVIRTHLDVSEFYVNFIVDLYKMMSVNYLQKHSINANPTSLTKDYNLEYVFASLNYLEITKEQFFKVFDLYDAILLSEINSSGFIAFIDKGIKKGYLTFDQFIDLLSINSDLFTNVIVKLISNTTKNDLNILQEYFQHMKEKISGFELNLTFALTTYILYDPKLRSQCIQFADLIMLPLILNENPVIREKNEENVYSLFPTVLQLDFDKYPKVETIMNGLGQSYLDDESEDEDEYHRFLPRSGKNDPSMKIFEANLIKFAKVIIQELKGDVEEIFIEKYNFEINLLYKDRLFVNLIRIFAWIFARTETSNPNLNDTIWELFAALKNANLLTSCEKYEFMRVFVSMDLDLLDLPKEKLDLFMQGMLPIAFETQCNLNSELFLRIIDLLNDSINLILPYGEFISTIQNFLAADDSQLSNSKLPTAMLIIIRQNETLKNQILELSNSLILATQISSVSWTNFTLSMYSDEISDALFDKLIQFIHFKLRNKSARIQHNLSENLSTTIVKFIDIVLNKLKHCKVGDTDSDSISEDTYLKLKEITLIFTTSFALLKPNQKFVRSFIIGICKFDLINNGFEENGDLIENEDEFTIKLAKLIPRQVSMQSNPWENLVLLLIISNDIPSILTLFITILKQSVLFNHQTMTTFNLCTTLLQLRLSVEKDGSTLFDLYQKEIVQFVDQLSIVIDNYDDSVHKLLAFIIQKLSPELVSQTFISLHKRFLASSKFANQFNYNEDDEIVQPQDNEQHFVALIKMMAVVLQTLPERMKELLELVQFDISCVQQWPEEVGDFIPFFFAAE